MTPLERDIERAVVNMVKHYGGWCLKWVCPGWAGVPDRIILLPGGRVMFVELKRPKGGRVAPMQKWWADQLSKLGFCHLFIKDQADIAKLKQIIEEWKP